MAQVILLVTRANDEHALAVEHRLREKGATVARFDPGRFPRDLTISIGDDALRIGDLDLAHVRSAWLRRLDYPVADPAQSIAAQAFASQQAQSALWGLSDLMEGRCLLANPLRAAVANDSGNGKLNQLRAAKGLSYPGFETPRTLVTNSPEDAQVFVRNCERGAICKPFRALQSNPIWCHDVKPDGDFGSARWAPWIFQERVERRCDVRVAVFGHRVMATEIHAPDVDCRRNLMNALHRPHALPSDVQHTLRLVNRELGLVMGVHDLIQRPDGGYVYLETNQQGQFLWLEHRTGQPYLESICDFLRSGDPKFE